MGPFGTATRLPVVNSVDVFDDDPELCATGLELFFRRSVPEDPMSGVWTATRPTVDDNFAPPQSLGIDGYSPTISGDGLTLYYVTTTAPMMVKSVSRTSIGGLWGSPIDVVATNYHAIDISADELRLLMSDGPNAFPDPPVVFVERESKLLPFGSPRPLDELSIAGDEGSSKGGSWNRNDTVIYLALDLPTGQGGTDVYVSSCE
jgi:hypothetical protein